MENNEKIYDAIIIGGGPAGLTAAIYCARAGLTTMLFEKTLIGGLATYTSEIENYPGVEGVISGTELMNRFKKQAKKFGVVIKLTSIKKVELHGKIKSVETFRKKFFTKTVIIATGGKPRLTGSRNEEKFLFSKGISFCATCDAAFNKDKVVFVVGSGDTAIEESLFLTQFARKVIISVVHDKGKVDAHEIAREKAFQNKKIEFIWNSMVESFNGNDSLESVTVRDTKTGTRSTIKVDNCFLFIGYIPNTEIFKEQLALTHSGHIITGDDMETNIPGVYAVGDVRGKSLYQIATAVGDGATAGYVAFKYIEELHSIHTIMDKTREKINLLYLYSALNPESMDCLGIIEEIKKEMCKKVDVMTIDTYKSHSLIKNMGIENKVPQLVFINSGEIIKTKYVIEKESIVDEINTL